MFSRFLAVLILLALYLVGCAERPHDSEVASDEPPPLVTEEGSGTGARFFSATSGE